MKTGEQQYKLSAGGDELRIASAQGGQHLFTPLALEVASTLEAETQFKVEGIRRACLVVLSRKVGEAEVEISANESLGLRE